jgi:hypothetical protein
MLGSAVVYLGLTIAFVGLIGVAKPIRWLRIPTRPRAMALAAAGVVAAGIGLTLPAPESRTSRVETRLDEFAPAWQFSERHTIRIAASPARVFEAIKRTRADEIFLFRTLIWIRGGGKPPPETILTATKRFESLIDVATHTTFVSLADDAPRELVVGTVVGWPPGTRRPITSQLFQKPLPPGFTLATMNFVVTPDGGNGSVVSTETRVFANSAPARRRFAVYWRVIYPGSAIIRRMWLRAIQRRATSSEPVIRVGNANGPISHRDR